MKVLIITPIEVDKFRRYEENKENEISWISKQWQEFKDIHPEYSFDLNFEYKIGTDLHEIGLNVYRFFSENDIDILKEEIDSMIGANELLGIIIDPILTFKEEKKYMYQNWIPGDTLESVYNSFSDTLPIYYYCNALGDFYCEPLCERINEDYRKKSYTSRKNIPCISRESFDEHFKAMFKYFIDFYEQKQEDSLELLRKKKED